MIFYFNVYAIVQMNVNLIAVAKSTNQLQEYSIHNNILGQHIVYGIQCKANLATNQIPPRLLQETFQWTERMSL